MEMEVVQMDKYRMKADDKWADTVVGSLVS